MALTFEQAKEYIGGFDSSEYERKHIITLAGVVEEETKAIKRETPEISSMRYRNLRETAERYIRNHINTPHKAELAQLIAAYNSIPEI